MLDAPVPRRGDRAPDAGDLTATARRYWFVPLVVAVVIALVGFVLAGHRTKVYESSGQVFFGLDASSSSNDASRVASTQAALAGSDVVVARAAKIAGIPVPMVRAAVDVTPTVEADVLVFTARSSDQGQAVALVKSMQEAYTAILSETADAGNKAASQSITALQAQLRAQLDRVSAAIAGGADTSANFNLRAALQQQISTLDQRAAELSVNTALAANGSRITAQPDQAEVVSPRPRRTAAMGALFGLLLGAAALWPLSRPRRLSRHVSEAVVGLGLVVIARLRAAEGELIEGDPGRDDLVLGLDAAVPGDVHCLAIVLDEHVDAAAAVTVAIALAETGRSVVLADAGGSPEPLALALLRSNHAGLPGAVRVGHLEAPRSGNTGAPRGLAERLASVPARDELLVLVCPRGAMRPETQAAVRQSDGVLVVGEEARGDELVRDVEVLMTHSAVLGLVLLRARTGPASGSWAGLRGPWDQALERFRVKRASHGPGPTPPRLGDDTALLDDSFAPPRT